MHTLTVPRNHGVTGPDELFAHPESPMGGRYIRRHSHDLGNCLSALDLQLMVLERSASTAGELDRLAAARKQIGCIAELQLRLGLRFRTPPATAVSLSACVEQCRSRQRIASEGMEIDWSFDGADCWFSRDSQAISVLVVEIADHWFARSGGTVAAYACDNCACFEMRHASESKQNPPKMEIDVRDELASVVERFGGVLVGEVGGAKLTVTFPLTPPGVPPL